METEKDILELHFFCQPHHRNKPGPAQLDVLKITS